MLDRSESTRKVRVTYNIGESLARRIRVRSAELSKTQSKYIEDLVMGDTGIDSGIDRDTERVI